ncbi:MAG TPA: ABC transporter permease [Chloroflexota bacterium]
MIDTLAETPVSSSPGGRFKTLAIAALRPVLVVGVALLAGMGIIIYTGQNPLPAYENLLIEPFRTWESFSSVLFFAIPLVLTGLCAAIAFRANIFNIGGEGQLQIGGLATAWLAIAWAPLPAIVLVPVLVLIGAVGGALWAGIAGWLRAYLGATELVSTIMLNYVAYDIVNYFVSPGGPLAGGGNATNFIPQRATFPLIGNTQFHWGFVVALICVVLVFVILYRMPLGYEVRMIGANASFAQYGGVAVPRVILTTMLLSGALAGIAGSVQVMGYAYQYSTSFIAAQWGFTGVTVALLARLEPVGVVVAALLYAVLEEGALLMENNTNVNHNIITVVQGLIILFVTVQLSFGWLRRRRAAARALGTT